MEGMVADRFQRDRNIPMDFGKERPYEKEFLGWFETQREKLRQYGHGELADNISPYDPDYDYYAAFLYGDAPDPISGHWSSQHKRPWHPNRFVRTSTGLLDTLNNTYLGLTGEARKFE